MGKKLARAVERAKKAPFVTLALRVNSRFGEDGGGYLAASMAYYGFLSVFPLILVALSAIGFLLAHDAGAQAQWSSRLAGAVPGLGNVGGGIGGGPFPPLPGLPRIPGVTVPRNADAGAPPR